MFQVIYKWSYRIGYSLTPPESLEYQMVGPNHLNKQILSL